MPPNKKEKGKRKKAIQNEEKRKEKGEERKIECFQILQKNQFRIVLLLKRACIKSFKKIVVVSKYNLHLIS